MGGCVASVMNYQNTRALCPNPIFVDRAAYGTINVKFTADETDRSGVYRCANISDKEHAQISTNWYRERNLLEVLQDNCRNGAEKKAIAYRKVEKTTKETHLDERGKARTWEYTHLHDPTYITYGEFWELLTSFGKGLAELGLQRDAKIAIYEETRWEWLTTMMGIWTQEMVGVTVYANLGEDALRYALKEAECGALVCNGKNVKKLLSMMKNSGLTKAIVIYLDELPSDVSTEGHVVVPWTAVLEKGRQSAKPFTVTSNSDLEVLIMYTSGTVAEPKGVVHSIGALTQGARALNSRLTELIGTHPGETYVAYLPAAHIFEFICENIFLSRGTLLCFGSPRTLTDAFARPHGDLTEYNPFFLIGVPRIFETIKKTVEARLPPVGSLKRTVFDRAYQSRLQALKEGKDTPYWNEKVFKVTRRLMGNQMRGICSGGAPLADKTQEWVNVVLGVPVAQGYGMTETVCNASVQRTGELDCVAGQFLRGVEARLLDTESYKHTDKPNQRGELLLRGNFMFKGYYKQPKMTEESLDAEGWLRTGDVAEIDATSGQMRIIGRVKALAKNVLGEYIALEALEALYCQHPVVVPNGICVLVDQQKPYIAALVLTDETRAMHFAQEHQISAKWPEILEDERFNSAVAASLAALAKKEGKMPFELVKHVRVLADEWTPENNLVTASLKVRRAQIDAHYATIIQKLFSE